MVICRLSHGAMRPLKAALCVRIQSTHGPMDGGAAGTRRAASMAVCLLVLLLAYRSTVAGLAWQWWDYLEYGFVLVGLTLWVCWRDRHLVLADVAPWPAVALVIVGGSLVWVVGMSAGIQAVEQIALLSVLMGWALAVLGRGHVPWILRLGSYLALALPAWGLIVGILQQLTVAANSVLLAISRLEATISGTFIAIPEGTFEVAAGCAGMSFFMSGLTVAVCYAEMTPLTTRGRLIAVALMASLSLVSNWIRVFLLIMIGHWTNMKSPLIADHGWFGWVIFAFMVMLFIWSTRFIEARYAVKLPEASPARGASTASVSFAGAMYGFTGLALLGPAGAFVLDAIPRAPSPAQIAGLNGANQFLSLPAVERQPLAFGDTVVAPPWAPRFAGADRHQVQRWVKGTDTVQVDRLVFSGRDRRHRLPPRRTRWHGRSLLSAGAGTCGLHLRARHHLLVSRRQHVNRRTARGPTADGVDHVDARCASGTDQHQPSVQCRLRRRLRRAS